MEPRSQALEDLLKLALSSSNIAVYGFYCHAGNYYASRSPDEAATFLSAELDAVNIAASEAKTLLIQMGFSGYGPFILSVGSTPTAHSATAENRLKLASLLHGTLELHAGEYPNDAIFIRV